MDQRQLFKFSFMADCIERGLTTPAEMLGAVKQASDALDRLEKRSEEGTAAYVLGNSLKGIGSMLNTGLAWGIPLAIAAPPLIGAGLGNLAAKAQDTDDYDVDDAKNQEVADAYRQEAARMRRQGLVRRRGMAAPRSGRAMF